MRHTHQYIKHSKIFLFADDLKLLHLIKTKQDADLLQSDVDAIVKWCQHNHMELNASKCFHIKLTRKKQILETTYSVAGIALREVSEIRDLGVTVDSKLTFSNHVNNIVSSATSTLGFVLRCSRELKNPVTLISLYNYLVRCKLEYCSAVWSPHHKNHCQRIESVQKRFMKHLKYKMKLPKSLSYDLLLKKFGLTPLEDRRTLLNLLFLYKLFNHEIDSQYLVSQLELYVPNNIPRRPKQYFNLKFYRTKLGMNSPIPTLLCQYNKIATTIDDLDVAYDAFGSFRRKICKCLQGS